MKRGRFHDETKRGRFLPFQGRVEVTVKRLTPDPKRQSLVEPQLEALGQGFGAQGPIVGALGLRYGALWPRFGALGSTLRALGPRVRALASGAMIGVSWAKIWATGSRLGL